MGFDPRKISYLSYFLNNYDKYGVDYNSIEVIMNGKPQRDYFTSDDLYADFFVMDQWKDIKFGCN